MKNNSKFKRIIAGFLCAVLSLGALPMSAFAFTAEPGKTCEAFYGHKYTGSDGNTYHSPESYQAIHYDTAGNQTVRSHNGGGARATLWLRDDSGERQVMCIESGVDYGAYENYESVNGKNSAYFQNLPATAQYGIMLASIYGWAPDRAVPVSGCNEDDFSIATQTIYWEYQQYLAELLQEENNSLWSAVLYGIGYSDDQIVTVALSQVGNVGGEPYWSWYGFNSRVEWCACFVSWCAKPYKKFKKFFWSATNKNGGSYSAVLSSLWLSDMDFARSSSSNIYLSKSDIKSLS